MSETVTALPDEETLAWVERQLGSFQVLSRYAHDHGYSQLWRLRSASGNVWLKMHAYPGKWAGEIFALTHWGPAVGRTPRVLASRAEPMTALIEEMPGDMASKFSLSAEAEERLWIAAGEWARELHRLSGEWLGAANPDGTPQGDMGLDAEGFVRQTYESRIAEGAAAGLFSSDEEQFIEWGAREWLPALRSERPAAVHRDYSPRNWLTNPAGDLTAVIDFEHARWDVRASDLCRFWDDAFVRRPELEPAFFSTYGQPDETFRAQMQAMRLLQNFGGLVWAIRIGDLPYAELNRRGLRRMMSEARNGV